MKNIMGRSQAAGVLLAVALAGVTQQAQAAASILIWPIDPWLAADANATELWIQNQGGTPTTMQVRIMRWTQEGGHERYQAQQEVVASPPIVRIDKGGKQLIRLIKQTQVPAGIEQAYRIVVDEIPQPANGNTPQIGLKIQMRYSIPLFVYGQGVATTSEGANHALVNTRDLSWRVIREGGKPALEVRNRSDVHLRLSQVSVQQGSQRREMADGLLGYVLPGGARSWPLPSGLSNPTTMTATINARDTQWQSSPAN